MKESNDLPNKNETSIDPSRELFSSSFANQKTHQAPEIKLPKGGGALKGIDEKFEVNPVNGTNSVSIPLPVSPARAEFSPSLALQYSSGQGNGLFGMGWGLGLPSIRRKTDKQLPKYQDNTESDTFIFAGAEDLIPKLDSNTWIPIEKTTSTHFIKEYCPRIEGSWIRIERWQELGTGIIHWRTISTNNVITVYGDSSNSRIENPATPNGAEIFEWLISYSCDNLGNIIRYEYKEENLVGVDKTIYEKNRTQDTVTNRYLKRIHYGNKEHYIYGSSPLPTASDFLFETVLDYGEHHSSKPTSLEDVGLNWVARSDAFSSFRSGFDIRTYRLCQRVLLFHKFTNHQAINEQLVASLDLTYSDEPDQSTNHNLEGFQYLREAKNLGYTYDQTTQQYSSKAQPPLSFYYQAHAWNTTIKSLEETALQNAPTGINNNAYQWKDLYGEGISGILIEKAQAWYYKQNLGGGTFSAAQLLHEQPSLAGLQWQDLEGSGEKQLVNWGSAPKGYFNYKNGDTWEGFQLFEQVPNRNLTNDPNARFVDLDGDGKPDLLITEEDLFKWYPSTGKKGFGKAQVISLPLDEDDGPRIVFADATQSIYLADMTGDGMTDIVRIKNGSVCYWANKGYGHFSKKITLAEAPKFTHEDNFNPQYLQLVDIDGSGTTDLVYFYKDSVQIWMNHNGNRFAAAPKIIHPFPNMDHQINIDVVDLLGNGTACLVWSSPHAKDQEQPLQYIDLTNGNKPHLLYEYKNNRGASVQFEYKSSTHYYLTDKKAGKPWATKLPFPVHVVSKTTSIDYIQNLVFTNLYSYHHGYYDQKEREFRGFGRVEQLDTEDFDTMSPLGASNILAGHLAPIKTISWYHTGASFKHQTLSNHYQTEYFQNPNPNIERPLHGIELPPNLDDRAYHEAFRACKGLLLRQEVYSLDIDNPNHEYPYQCSESGYQVQLVQSHEGQKYASFIVVPVQSMAYGYEQNPQDPRIQQSLVLETDSYGIPTQTASIIYPRLNVPTDLPWMLKEAQEKTHATYTKISLTNDVSSDHSYRIRTSYEEQIFEVLGLNWTVGQPYYTPQTFIALLSSANEIGFEQNHMGTAVEKRLSGHGKTQFLKDDLSLELDFGIQESLGIPYKSYQLVSTPELREQLYTTEAGGNYLLAQDNLDQAATSFYKEFNNDENWWLPSGTSVFPHNAAQNFYLPIEVKDAADISTYIEYDIYQLFPVRVTDSLDNNTQVEYDYRVLQPKLVTDPNGNQSAVAFDALGIVVKSAIMGKVVGGVPEGDSLDHPTAIMEYDFHNWYVNGQPNYIHSKIREEHYSQNPVATWQESYEYSDGGGNVIMSKVQTKGGEAKLLDNGQVITVNTNTHPIHTERWIGNGRTIINNKGLPIKQYEPYFSVTSDFEDAPELVEIGYSPILYYDAAGRNIKTLMPDGTFTKVEFDAWKSTTYDVNDTVLDSDWYHHIINNAPNSSAEFRAAKLTAIQHANTPTIAHLDCLGRTIYAENDGGDASTQNIAIFTQTDLAGRFSLIYDQLATKELLAHPNNYNTTRKWSSYAKTNLLGEAVYTKTAVKGESFQLVDALGRMVRIWDNPSDALQRLVFRTKYDELHRPLETYVQRGSQPEICFAQTEYGETVINGDEFNLRGQAYLSRDQSGEMTSKEFDFKGNPLFITRKLTKVYDQTIDWNQSIDLEDDTFETSTSYDALNRPTLTTLPDSTLLRSTYNKGGYLEQLEAKIQGQGNFKTFLNGQDYDAKGQKQWVKYGNNTITKYFYEAETFRLIDLVTLDSNQNKLQDLKYTYDPSGNVMEVEDKAQSVFYYNNQAILPKKQYTYDYLNRLTKATGREHAGAANNNPAIPNHNDFTPIQNHPHANIQSAVSKYTQTYGYDEVGNISWMKHQYGTTGGWKREYDYHQDATNRLKSTKINGATTLPFDDYDVHGNMTKMPHLQALTWNFADQLTAVQLQLNPAGNFAYYNYDGAGQRVRKIITQGSKKHKERLYLGGLERYREYDLNGYVKKERWTLQIDDIAQVDTLTVDNSTNITNPESLIRYQYRDHLGSASLECNEDEAVISYEEYHPYGTTSYQASSSSADISLKRYRFTNKERDDETGLYYFGVRYYAAWLGRWTSSDPGGFVDGLNLYHYVHNNPVNGVDEMGYQMEEAQQTPEETDPIKKHKIKDGDNLTHIASKYNTTVDNLIRWNNFDGASMSGNGLFPGDELTVSNILGTNESDYRLAAKDMLKKHDKNKKRLYRGSSNLMKDIIEQPNETLVDNEEENWNETVSFAKPITKIIGTTSTVLVNETGKHLDKFIKATELAELAGLEAYNFSKTVEGATKFMTQHKGISKIWSYRFWGNQYVSSSFVQAAKNNHANSIMKGMQAQQGINAAGQGVLKLGKAASFLKYGGVALGGAISLYQYGYDENYGFKNIVPENEYNKEITLAADGTMVGIGTVYPVGTVISFIYFLGVRPFL